MENWDTHATLRSRAERRVRRFLTRTWQGFLVGAIIVAMGVLAVINPGLVRADVHLDEGTIHVAKQDSGGLGVLNAQIEALSEYATVGDSKFEVLQDEDRVLVHGTESSTLVSYDPALNRLDSPVQLPDGAKVTLAGGTLLVVDSSSGKAWFGNPEDLLELEFEERKADMELGDFGTATLTFDGDVIGLDVQRSLLLRPADDSVQESSLPFELEGVVESARLSSVGDEAVLLDTASGRIWMEGMDRAFEVSGAQGAQLVPHARDALSGGRDARAVYATRAGLIALTDDGPRSLTGNLDAPASVPVQVGECVYAAFGTQFVKSCRDETSVPRDVPVDSAFAPNPPDVPVLVFQTNNTTVVLNDVVRGTSWMVDRDMLQIDNWDDVVPPEDTTDDITPTVTTVLPPDREVNNAPVAEDDDLAARAGRSTVMDVLDNDTDQDGDILTISAESEISGATLETVRGGSGLQVSVDVDTTGTLEFTYTISDGRGGKDVARVRVEVLPADPLASNGAPYRHARAAPLAIHLNDEVTKRVLLDWRDPDGDSLVLVRAWLPPESADEVSFTPEGAITFRDIGTTTGQKKVNIQVTDGVDIVDGEMLLEVSDEVVPPIARGDFETVRAGRTVTVRPLVNDVGGSLSLTDVEAAPDCECTVLPNYRDQSFSFSAEKPGVSYVTYKVSNGPVATGLVRIDVRSESEGSPPVAALDVALLPPGGSVTVDPLLNDTDLDEDVLVVQSVSSAPGLQVVLARRHLVTVTASSAPENPVTLTYRVSDGQTSVFGTIVVIPTKSTGSPEPQALDDEVRIRAGATQSIDVLGNDTSPLGLDLELDKLVENPLRDRAWIDRNRLRISVPAGTQSSRISLVYQLRDGDGRVASATVSITVVSEDAQNTAPAPPPIEDRVLANTVVKLVIDMDGIDPNGDSVSLLGIGSGPRLGRVMGVGDGWLTYEAYQGSEGTDVFSYQVTDSLGAVGKGEIRVGVAPAGPQNSPPVGILDEVLVRPGSNVQVPALRNDVDIDGDAIRYVPTEPDAGGEVEIDGVDVVEVIEDRDLSFVAPQQPGVYIGSYRIEDVRGAQGSGELQVMVDEDAPLQPPETRDDVVLVSALEGEEWVEVDVTANDLDPDGRTQDLQVEVPGYGAPDGEGAYVAPGESLVTVPVQERMQKIRYSVVDADGLRATGLVLVPGRNNAIPTLTDPDIDLEVVAGQTASLNIAELVRGSTGGSVRVTSADDVSATHGRTRLNPQKIDYTPDISHVGPASVVFQVSDVVSDQTEEPPSAFITVPITVIPPPNASSTDDGGAAPVAFTSPELLGGTPLLLVGPGEGDARLDLRPLFRDADGDDFFFEEPVYVEGDKAISWRTSSDKGTLIASTATGTQPGTTLLLKGNVIDTRQGSTSFEIRLEVISSTKPLATALTDVVEARAGTELPISVLANDRSNLLDDKSLTLLGADIINGSGTIGFEGDVVRITPADGFVGTMTARYRIVDATKDPNRNVDGTIQLTVKDRPSQPGAPRDATVGNGTVSFTYTPGSANGFEISSRTATAINAEGSVVATAQCASTTCTVTGLPNGNPYRFMVVEENEVGKSDDSPLSAPLTPDVKPSAPAAPTVEFGDGFLEVAWSEPTWENPSNPGSDVDRYTLTLLDEAGKQISEREVLGKDSTALVWDGLSNGTRYRFMVRAINKAGPSPFSEPSGVEWPAGPPLASPSITAVATQNPLGGAFEVTWAAASINANGDPVTKFIVTPVSEQGVQTSRTRTVAVSGSAEQKILIEGLGQKAHKFRVQGVNKAGPGAVAETAQWQTAWELPKILSFSATAGNGEIAMNVSTNYQGKGDANPRTEYRVNGGDWRPYPSAGRATKLKNGQVYELSVRVVVDGNKASAPSEVLSRMPRSPQPAWGKINKPGLIFRGFTDSGAAQVLVPLDKPATLVASGGWTPTDYWALCAGDASCSPNGTTRADDFFIESKALRDGPATVKVTFGHFQSDEVSVASVKVEPPFSGSWDPATGKLLVQLNYVRNARCRVTGDGVDIVKDQNGVAALGFTETVQAAAGGPALPAELDVSCTFGSNFSANLTLSG